MNKSITILTSEESFHNNYGAALQGYALYCTLQEMGLDPQIVRYEGGQFQDNACRYYLMRAKRRIRLLIQRIRPDKTEREIRSLTKEYALEIRLRERLFMSFQNENMVFYNKHRMTWQQLQRDYPHTDYYICGSDQIWNPHFKGGRNDPGYFLAFAPKGAKKIAYAPSFGCDDLPDEAKKNLRNLLYDFTAISVREKSGVDIVKKNAERDAQWVLDPTMLRTGEQWASEARLPEVLPDRYILSYRFADSQATKKMIDEISKTIDLPVITLPLSIVSMKDDYIQVFDAGPREFIGIIQNAELVCTDSFHATVFSILMNTPVCVFLRESYDGKSSMNSRVQSLLEMLGLQENIITENDTLEKALRCVNVDYSDAYTILAERRKHSLDYLRAAIEG